MTKIISPVVFFIVSIASLISFGFLIGINYFNYDRNIIISIVGAMFTVLNVLIMIVIYFTWKHQRRSEKRHDAMIDMLSITIGNMHTMSDVFTNIIIENRELLASEDELTKNDNRKYIKSLRQKIDDKKESSSIKEYRRLISGLEVIDALIDNRDMYFKFLNKASLFKKTFHLCNFFNIGPLYDGNKIEIITPNVYKYPNDYPDELKKIFERYEINNDCESDFKYYVHKDDLEEHLKDLQRKVKNEMESFNAVIKEHIRSVK
ncbi:hypothetical protein [Vibrio furnissii]|uniref:hypothetical protein n=2 Tax=Vibrio TaxID=662 RepID=UPI001EEB1905|nr:hypothetical protein [Vibrio furnissii]